jgi:hypothetical protein
LDSYLKKRKQSRDWNTVFFFIFNIFSSQ